MIIIGDKLIADGVTHRSFVCNLEACKGACCWEGDFGAPLEQEEMETLDKIYDKVKPFLRPEGIKAIEEQGTSVFVEEERIQATTLVPHNSACAYLTYEDNGIAKCGIEKAYEAGVVDYPKPISCHLYPIRVTKFPTHEVLEYNEWDICAAACTNGKKLNVRVFEFLKGPLTRAYGEEFYEQLEQAVMHKGGEQLD